MGGDSAYIDGLKMLARRELSESQVRQRLARREHAPEDIDTAIERLKAERALDDARVAGAIARTQTSIRGRGRLRVRREIEATGIAPAIAQRAVDDLFQEIDADALLEAALARRLRGAATIADDGEFRRLYRFLVAQGFDSGQVVAALRQRRARRT